MTKSLTLRGLIGVIVSILSAGGVFAQPAQFPSRAVNLMVPFAPGGSTDTLARLLTNELSPMWGKPIVIENRGGALGQLAMSTALSRPPDGHNLVISTSGTHNMNPWLIAKLQYDPTKTTHITKLIDAPYAFFVSAQAPVNSVQEFISWARSQSKPLTYGYAGASYQVIIRDFMTTTQINAQGVPYRAQAQAITDLLAGTLDFLVDATYIVQPLANDKRVKVLMVTSNERSPLLPHAPTMSELGLPPFKPTVWAGLAGPANMPGDLVQKIAEDVKKAMATPVIQERAAAMGMDVRILQGEAFAKFVERQTEIWGDAIKAANIEPQ